MKEVPMPDRIRKLTEKCGTQSHGKAYKNRVEFLNCTEDKFDQENDDISTGETTYDEEPIFYPNLIAEISGVELETYFEDTEDTAQETRVPSSADRDRAAAAAQNSNFSKTTGVDIPRLQECITRIVLLTLSMTLMMAAITKVCHGRWKRTLIGMTAMMALYQVCHHS